MQFFKQLIIYCLKFYVIESSKLMVYILGIVYCKLPIIEISVNHINFKFDFIIILLYFSRPLILIVILK